MAAKKRVAKVGAKASKTAVQARYNPYVQRLVQDEDLRSNLLDAYESARSAYARLSNGKSATSQIFDDKKLQKDVKSAAGNLRDVTVALREAPRRRRRGGGFFRLLLLLVVGAGAAVALSEDLRKKLLDALFGAEEEFEYTSSTTPSTATTPSTPAAGPTSTA